MKNPTTAIILGLLSAISMAAPVRPLAAQNRPSIRRIDAPNPTAAPTLSVRNDYRVTQYIFVDRTFLGTVAPSTERSFDVPTGTHTVISADSQDPTDNPATEQVAFRRGSQYSYRVFTSVTHHGG
jgi:hypothetical protein